MFAVFSRPRDAIGVMITHCMPSDLKISTAFILGIRYIIKEKLLLRRVAIMGESLEHRSAMAYLEITWIWAPSSERSDEAPTLAGFEEPENGIHPHRIHKCLIRQKVHTSP